MTLSKATLVPKITCCALTVPHLSVQKIYIRADGMCDCIFLVQKMMWLGNSQDGSLAIGPLLRDSKCSFYCTYSVYIMLPKVVCKYSTYINCSLTCLPSVCVFHVSKTSDLKSVPGQWMVMKHLSSGVFLELWGQLMNTFCGSAETRLGCWDLSP